MTYSMQYEDISAENNIVIGNIQVQVTCDIPVLFRKLNPHANFLYTSHVTTNNPLLSY